MIKTSWSLLDQAHESLCTVVAGVDADGWAERTPCEEWNVAQVLRHAAGDQLAYAAAITGSGGPSENPFDPSIEAPDRPAGFLKDALTSATRAFDTITPDSEEVASPLPQGAMPADTVLGAAALDAAVHAWDIAVATDRPSPLSSDLAVQLMPTAEAIVEALRGFAFAPALDPVADDDAASVLLRYLGRDPHWKP